MISNSEIGIPQVKVPRSYQFEDAASSHPLANMGKRNSVERIFRGESPIIIGQMLPEASSACSMSTYSSSQSSGIGKSISEDSSDSDGKSENHNKEFGKIKGKYLFLFNVLLMVQ